MQGGEDREEGENILRGTLWELRAQSIPSHPPVALHRKSHLTHKARHQQCVTTHLLVPSHTMFYQFPVGLSPDTLFLVCANAFTIHHPPLTKPGGAIPTRNPPLSTCGNLPIFRGPKSLSQSLQHDEQLLALSHHNNHVLFVFKLFVYLSYPPLLDSKLLKMWNYFSA